jgi:hypothetical protein
MLRTSTIIVITTIMVEVLNMIDEPAALVGQGRCEDSNDEDVVPSTCRVA